MIFKMESSQAPNIPTATEKGLREIETDYHLDTNIFKMVRRAQSAIFLWLLSRESHHYSKNLPGKFKEEGEHLGFR